MTIYFS